MCEPHTHTIIGLISRWHMNCTSYISHNMCVRSTHITYYKRVNTRANAELALLLSVCMTHTHEANPPRMYLISLSLFPSFFQEKRLPSSIRCEKSNVIRSYNIYVKSNSTPNSIKDPCNTQKVVLEAGGILCSLSTWCSGSTWYFLENSMLLG